MRVDNQPFGNLNELLYSNAFTTHPYKNPVIGSMADLDAATIQDVRQFFDTYYVPANATVVIAGDFDVRRDQGPGHALLRPRPAGRRRRCRATSRRNRRRSRNGA